MTLLDQYRVPGTDRFSGTILILMILILTRQTRFTINIRTVVLRITPQHARGVRTQVGGDVSTRV